MENKSVIDQETQIRLIRIENKLDNLVISQCKTLEEVTSQGKRLRTVEDQQLLSNERNEGTHNRLEGKIEKMEIVIPRLEDQVNAAGNKLIDRLWNSFNTVAIFAVGIFLNEMLHK